MKKTTLKTRRQKNEYEKKDDDSLPQKKKCVPDHDDRFIHRCRVCLYEDNQLYMLSSIYLLNIRRLYENFSTHTHSCWTREKKKEKEE